MLKIKFLMS